MVERLGEMRKGRRERIEKGSREGIEKDRVFLQYYCLRRSHGCTIEKTILYIPINIYIMDFHNL